MKTISERIDAAIGELEGMPMRRNQLCRTILAEHFTEPWLDAPDGPGWWFVDVGNKEPGVVRLQSDAMELSQKSMFKRWQRVIGPSE